MGSWAQIIQLGFGLWSRAWGFGREHEKSESEEEYLIGYAKRRSGIDPNDQNDIPRSSSDRVVHHTYKKDVNPKISKGKLLPQY